jgi:uncharacterized membrane protein YkgB
MFSVFPQLLFLSHFSPLILRVALAVVVGYAAWKHVPNKVQAIRALGVVETAVAVLLFVGAWTQVVALINILIIMVWFTLKPTRPVSRGEAALALILSISLITTGAGIFAFDLPL